MVWSAWSAFLAVCSWCAKVCFIHLSRGKLLLLQSVSLLPCLLWVVPPYSLFCFFPSTVGTIDCIWVGTDCQALVESCQSGEMTSVQPSPCPHASPSSLVIAACPFLFFHWKHMSIHLILYGVLTSSISLSEGPKLVYVYPNLNWDWTICVHSSSLFSQSVLYLAGEWLNSDPLVGLCWVSVPPPLYPALLVQSQRTALIFITSDTQFKIRQEESLRS